MLTHSSRIGYPLISLASIFYMQKAIIVYNESAGSGNNSIREVMEALERKDYSLRICKKSDEHFPDILEQEWDLVVVAGGDGTVKKSALKTLGRNLPVAIWPIGSANNIASTFAITKSMVHIDKGIHIYLNVGVFQSRTDRDQFLESAGVGLMSRMMEEMEKQKGEVGKQEKIKGSLKVLKKIVSEQKEYDLQLELDDQVISGRFLGVEVMNTPYMGPKLFLAPQAKAGDGIFEVVLFRKEHAKLMVEYLEDKINGVHGVLDLPVYRSSTVKISGKGLPMHSDDDLYYSEEEQEYQIFFGEKDIIIPGVEL